jgi:FIMAH domain-containing protein
LQAPLNAALKQLDKNNNKGACGPLGAFLDQVNEKRSNGQLTSAQADELRQQATAIQKQIGCTGSSSTASTASSQSNSPIENMVNSALSSMNSMQSEQTGKSLDKVQKGLDLYSDFFSTK